MLLCTYLHFSGRKLLTVVSSDQKIDSLGMEGDLLFIALFLICGPVSFLVGQANRAWQLKA